MPGAANGKQVPGVAVEKFVFVRQIGAGEGGGAQPPIHEMTEVFVGGSAGSQSHVRLDGNALVREFIERFGGYDHEDVAVEKVFAVSGHTLEGIGYFLYFRDVGRRLDFFVQFANAFEFEVEGCIALSGRNVNQVDDYVGAAFFWKERGRSPEDEFTGSSGISDTSNPGVSHFDLVIEVVVDGAPYQLFADGSLGEAVGSVTWVRVQVVVGKIEYAVEFKWRGSQAHRPNVSLENSAKLYSGAYGVLVFSRRVLGVGEFASRRSQGLGKVQSPGSQAALTKAILEVMQAQFGNASLGAVVWGVVNSADIRAGYGGWIV